MRAEGCRAGACPPRVLLVASSGGHLLQLLQLSDLWPRGKRLWVSFEKSDAISLLEGEQVIWAFHPTNRNIPNLLRNLRLAGRVFASRKISAVVSTGAGVAVPFAILAKLFRVRFVYLESMARISSPSLTGRLVYPMADTFIVQWPELLEVFPKAHHYGTVFDLR